MPALTLTGARVLNENGLVEAPVSLAEGHIVEGSFPAIDLDGYDVLPGIVDLHGDAFERHIAPRPSAPFPIISGLAATDRDAAVNGVTTAWIAQSWSWEGGMRGPDFAEALLEAHAACRGRLATDLRVQIRFETHAHDSADRLLAAVRRFGIDYVIFNNHLDEAIEMSETDPAAMAGWAGKSGKSAAELLAIVTEAKARAREVPRTLCRLADGFDVLGVRYGSHDDPDGETRETFAMLGARICEFPTAHQAASVACASGDPVLMGAPNVVRGGSQAGKIAAVGLIRAGKCDALVSDYHYPALALAAFRLADMGVMDLAAAWRLISAAPAQIMGLADRGRIAPGLRADLVVIDRATRAIEATIAGGRVSHLSGEAAARFMGAGAGLRLAAE
ncbi:alpha-D-ribose 1-methylphosphonate 5-triphosphate diphosphatase [Limimaricola sp.]|uniref:alpha-D-ribose 1-methylphosphonate 5-triphosphate diphosphatase n=1 Tax=Limimaricola sp. TaxID=2211665 RepID=UPI0025BE4475|nr:alpha-D-ribose 1-methylphosphonate 5-triphosphate diphosphatase [Limimaricola sp.]